MPIHRLSSITIGVPDVAGTLAYYADFGLTLETDGWLSTTDGGRQLRVVPAPARAPVQAALLVTACLTLATLPLVLGTGRTPLVPSQQPLDYGRGLLAVHIVAGTAAVVVVGSVSSSAWPSSSSAWPVSPPVTLSTVSAEGSAKPSIRVTR